MKKRVKMGYNQPHGCFILRCRRIEGAVKKGNFMARAKDRAKTKQRQAKKENLLICRRGAELDESLYGKSHKLAAPKIGRYIMK